MTKQTRKKINNQLVAQNRRLIEGRYNFTVWELRLYLKMVEMIQRDDKDFQEYKIYFKDLINEYGGNSNRDYEIIQRCADRLLKKIVKLEYIENGEMMIVKTQLLSSAKYPKDWRKSDDNAYLKLSFNPHLKPYLLDLKGNFLLYDRRNILRLKSKFSVRIYQLLKSHERETKDSVVVEYKITELRKMLLVDDEGNPTNEYSKYAMFKKRVLLQAQKELKEHTDIAFSFDEIKKGRRIDTIRFYVRKNRKKKSEPSEPTISKPTQKPKSQQQQPIEKIQPTTTETPVVEKPKYHNQAYQKLIDIGVAASTAYELVKSHNTPYIITSIRQAQQANQVSPKTNFAGFVINCIKKGTYKEVAQKNQVKKTKEKAKQDKLEVHQKIMGIERIYQKGRREYIQNFRNILDKKTTAEVIQIARDKFERAKEMTERGIKEKVYFNFALVDFFSEKGVFPTEYINFENYMQKHHNVKIGRENDNGWYEIVE